MSAFRRVAAIASIAMGTWAVASRVASAQTPILLENGELIGSTPSNQVPYELHSFFGLAGQTVVITLESYTFDTRLTLLDQTGTSLYQNDDAVVGETTNSILRVVLPRDGQYYIVVETANGSGSGQYLLIVADVTQGPSAAATVPAPTVSQPSVATPPSSPPQRLNHACSTAVKQLTDTVTGGRRINFPLQNVGRFSGEAPPGRADVFTFGMSGPDVKYVLESPEFLTILTKIFLEECPSAGAIIVANTDSGTGIALGLINNQIAPFQCAESLGFAAADRANTNVPWGYYFCEL